MKYVIEGKDVYKHQNNIPESGVIVDTELIYEIGTFYGKHIGRPAEIKGDYLILDTSKECFSRIVTIPLGQIHTIKKIVRCVHLREITTEGKEKYLVCTCTDCSSFLEHIGDERDCSDFCKYRREL